MVCLIQGAVGRLTLPFSGKNHIETRHHEQGYQDSQGEPADGPGGHGMEHLAAFFQVQGQGDEPEVMAKEIMAPQPYFGSTDNGFQRRKFISLPQFFGKRSGAKPPEPQRRRRSQRPGPSSRCAAFRPSSGPGRRKTIHIPQEGHFSHGRLEFTQGLSDAHSGRIAFFIIHGLLSHLMIMVQSPILQMMYIVKPFDHSHIVSDHDHGRLVFLGDFL
jgi:hypothetical protein